MGAQGFLPFRRARERVVASSGQSLLYREAAWETGKLRCHSVRAKRKQCDRAASLRPTHIKKPPAQVLPTGGFKGSGVEDRVAFFPV